MHTWLELLAIIPRFFNHRFIVRLCFVTILIQSFRKTGPYFPSVEGFRVGVIAAAVEADRVESGDVVGLFLSLGDLVA